MGTPSAGRVSELLINEVKLEGVQDVSHEISAAPIDVTDKDENGWDVFIPGQGSHVISGTMVYEEDSASQEDFIDAILAKTIRGWRWYPLSDTLVTNDEWVNEGFPTSITIDSPNKEALSFPFTIQMNSEARRKTPFLLSPSLFLTSKDMNGNGDNNVGWSDTDDVGAALKKWVSSGSIADSYVQLSGTPRPTYTTPFVRGNPVVEFLNSDTDFLNADGVAADYQFLTDGSDYTAYWMFRLKVLPNSERVIFSNGTESQSVISANLHYDISADILRYRVGNGLGAGFVFDLSSAPLKIGTETWMVFTAVHEAGAAGDDLSLYVNRRKFAGGDPATSFAAGAPPDPMHINIDPGSLFNGGVEMALGAFYPVAHSDSDRLQGLKAIEDEFAYRFPNC